MEYEYRPMKEAKAGDVVQYIGNDKNIETKSFELNNLYILSKDYSSSIIFFKLDEKKSTTTGWNPKYFKLLKTYPGKEAEVNDTVISITHSTSSKRSLGSIHKVHKKLNSFLSYETNNSANDSEFLVIKKNKLENISNYTNKDGFVFKRPNESDSGWYILARHNSNKKLVPMYLRKDLSLCIGTGYATKNDGYFKTEEDAYEALDKYIKNNKIEDFPEPEVKDRKYIIKEWIDSEMDFLNENIESEGYPHYPYLGEQITSEAVESLLNDLKELDGKDKQNDISLDIDYGCQDSWTVNNNNLDVKDFAFQVLDNQTKNKGTEMKDTKIEIKIDGKAINLAKEEKVKPKTALERKSKYLTVWYNSNGTKIETTEDSPKQATKLLQSPARIGWTFASYKQSISRTTDIPVKDV